MSSYTYLSLKWRWHLEWKLKKIPVHTSWEVQLPGAACVGLSLTKFMRIEGYVKTNVPTVWWANKRSCSVMIVFIKCDAALWEVPRCDVRLMCVLKCYEEIYSQNLMTAALVSMKSVLKKQHSACFNLHFIWTLGFSRIACWRRSSCGVTSLTFSVRTSQRQASAVKGAHFNLNAHCRMKRIYG
jgi:hypothetical protein